MPYLPPSQPQARWLVVLAQLSGAVLLAMVLISALPFLLLLLSRCLNCDLLGRW